MDLEKFRRVEPLKGFRVAPQKIQTLRTAPRLQSVLLKRSRLSNVAPSSLSAQKLVLLKADITEDEIAAAQQVLRDSGWDEPPEVEPYELELGYEHLSAEEALRVVLPSDMEIPTSFETIGHVAHFNLKDAHLPYKKLIGQITLDKNPNLKTIVTKVGSLKNEFRTFEMEVIAGVDSTECTVKESGMTFTFDFRKVYWNGRLCRERERLLAKMDASSVLVDAFAGIGAFACFAAAKGLKVFANDLNPRSVEAIEVNSKRNKVDLQAFNMDAREFLRKIFREKPWSEDTDVHVVMNLPELALNFLDVFQEHDLRLTNIHIHCHCFARKTPPSEEIHPRLEEALGEIPRNVDIVDVRNVSPNKQMYCVEFVLDAACKRRRVHD